MSFESIIGQPLAIELAQRWLAQQSTQPLLFHGPEGVGKRTVALEAAKALNCVAPAHRSTGAPAQVPCDVCLSCRKIAAGNHPDVRFLDLAQQAAERREAVEKQQSLRLEMILSERRRLLQSPNEGQWKVSILEDAHRLTPDAANALLKILEEPPSRTALILLTPYRDRLFSTILSRCQPVRFRPLTYDEMRRCLSGLHVPVDAMARLIELSRGSPGRAVHLSREEHLAAAAEADSLWQRLGQAALRELAVSSAGEGGTRAGRMNPAPRSDQPQMFTPQHRLDAGASKRGGGVNRTETEKRLQYLLFPAVRDLYAGKRGAEQALGLVQAAFSYLRHNVQPALVYDNLLFQLKKQKVKR